MKNIISLVGIILVFNAGLFAKGLPKVLVSTEGDGKFKVEAEFLAQASPAECWPILTDYDRLDEFISFLKTSRVIERENGFQFVEQLAKSRFLFFSKTIKVILKIKETAGESLIFEDVSHEDFSFYHGKWTLKEDEGGTRLTYALTAHIKFFAPEFIAKGVMERNVTDYLEELSREISKRFPSLEAGSPS